MPPIINAQGISKQYGVIPLLKDISFAVSEGNRVGLIGPNGAGKSTLLQILVGQILPDKGQVAVRKQARLSYVAQHSEFGAGATVRSVVEKAIARAAVPEADRLSMLAKTLGRAGFDNPETPAASLSGGWIKRLAIVAGLAQAPDILFLDEPTNHLDLAGIQWLEEALLGSDFASVVVSHDRYLLENFANEVVELNRVYTNGLLRIKGNYSKFLEAREESLEALGRRQKSLSNRVKSEIEWLRRGPKARGTKSKSRIDEAQRMISELGDLRARRRVRTAGIDFSASDRRSRQLIELEQVGFALPERTLFSEINLRLGPGTRLGLVGPNGSGKTTLLRLFRGELKPTRGKLSRAKKLKAVYFDQKRELDPDLKLRRALAPESDSVVYQGRVIHLAAWAARFQFSKPALSQPVGRLSGGERARVLIAQLMLQPADLLLLDEPTNDLDIPTLEVLEESLLEFSGALVIVTHDRYLMDRVATLVLGLDGSGRAECFADYSQWEVWQRSQGSGQSPSDGVEKARYRPAKTKKKLTYKEARELERMEETILKAEERLQSKRSAVEDPAIVSDAPRLVVACTELEEAEKAVNRLYARWQELEQKRDRVD